jgi:hypothetical protein
VHFHHGEEIILSEVTIASTTLAQSPEPFLPSKGFRSDANGTLATLELSHVDLGSI